jgi:hypothetical protein
VPPRVGSRWMKCQYWSLVQCQWEVKCSTWREACYSDILSTTNTTWTTVVKLLVCAVFVVCTLFAVTDRRLTAWAIVLHTDIRVSTKYLKLNLSVTSIFDLGALVSFVPSGYLG